MDDTLDAGEPLDETIEVMPTVGQRLRTARENGGLDLADISKRTRIPERHLQSIEEDDFGKLPARTYAVGFSRSYARIVDLDEGEIADQVRAQLAAEARDGSERANKFEAGDPERIPSRGLAWFSALAIVLLLVGGFSFYRSYFAPGMGPAPLQEERRAGAEQAAGATPDLTRPAAPARDGQVVFTALEDGIWARFYDGAGERLYEAQMSKGERFEVPQASENPQIWTGRPDAFRITIDGQEVPRLAEDDQVMRDVGISAEALLARETTSAAPVPEASATPPASQT